MNQSRIYSVLGAVVIIAIVVLGWLLVVSPQLKQVATANDQVATANAENSALSQALANLKSQSDDLPKLTSELDALRVRVPETEQVDTFLAEVQSLATANGVSVTGVTPAEAVAYPAATTAATGSTASSGTAAATPTGTPTPTPTPVPTALTAPTTTTSSSDVQPSAALRADLYTINFTMSVSGPGPGIVSFVQALQKGSRLFLVTTVSLTTQAPDALGTSTIGGYLFVVTTPAEIAARSAAATAPPTATPTATPTPSPTATPNASSTATPTPTSTPAPTRTPTPTPTP